MVGFFSVEKKQEGQMRLVFHVRQKEDVDTLTLEMIDAGFDVLYEPAKRQTGYESCVLCGEGSSMKIIADDNCKDRS